MDTFIIITEKNCSVLKKYYLYHRKTIKVMIKLKIDNFGPIKHAELDFKKINILIGQQGAGKSCILKIAAFCMWLEKTYILKEFSINDMQKKEFVETYLLDFYKLNDYATKTNGSYSKIVFNDNDNFKIFIDFKEDDENWINFTPISESDVSYKHVSYIPAERCLVSVIPNLMELKLGDSSISKYIIDWGYAHRLYTKKNPFDILGLNSGFYYDDKSQTDYLTVNDNGITREIKFANAASGFQSVVPICVLTNYYLNHRQQSLKDRQLKQLNDNKDNCLLIEEPEENIFPETQYNLVKWLVSALNNGNDNMLFLTTHSPYILSSFNNLIQADISAKNSNTEEISKIVETKDFVQFDEISVFEIIEGNNENIKNYDNKLIDCNGIDRISEVINVQFSKLLEYEGD